MSVLREIGVVLFDVDGTLIDSNAAHAEAWTTALAAHGIVVERETVRRRIGMGADKLLPAIAGVAEDSPTGRAIGQRKKAVFDQLLPSLQATAGARPLLEFLQARGLELLVATSGDEAEVDALLRQAGVDDLIPRRTSKDDAQHSKPSPDIVQAALARAEHKADRAILIGDTPYDLEAARRAGIDAIALRCGGHWSDADLNAAIEILDDPRALLTKWQAAGTRRSGSAALAGTTRSTPR
jgi:HAD superfamily hydrolase (TIGR01549 family)